MPAVARSPSSGETFDSVRVHERDVAWIGATA